MARHLGAFSGSALGAIGSLASQRRLPNVPGRPKRPGRPLPPIGSRSGQALSQATAMSTAPLAAETGRSMGTVGQQNQGITNPLRPETQNSLSSATLSQNESSSTFVPTIKKKKTNPMSSILSSQFNPFSR